MIHDTSTWGNIDNFKGTVDPNNPFSDQSPRTDGLLDEVMDGAWCYQRTYAECKEMAGDKDFMVMGVIFYGDKTGLMFIRGQDWNHCHLHSQFLINNAGTGQRHGMFLERIRDALKNVWQC